MTHLHVTFYALVAIIGVAALALSSFGVIRSRVPYYWYLLAFYAGFTVMIVMIYFREYLYLNVAGYSIAAVYVSYAVTSIVEPLFLTALALFLHRFTSVRLVGIRDVSVVSIGLIAALTPIVPGAVSLDVSTLTINFGTLYRISFVLYFVMMVYILVTASISIRRDKPPREMLLQLTLLAFGFIGFAESVVGLIGGSGQSSMVLQPDRGSLLVSTVPYAVFGGILIYFFGSYLLADAKPAGSVDKSFLMKYGITRREEEVMVLMNRGLSNREIAEHLYVSLATVKTHAHNIYEKTGASSRYELFHML